MRKGQGDISQSNGEFYSAVSMPRGPDPYLNPSGNTTGEKTPQGKGWQALIPENRHPFFIKFMARFLQKYTKPYFAKVLIAVNKTLQDFSKFGGSL